MRTKATYLRQFEHLQSCSWIHLSHPVPNFSTLTPKKTSEAHTSTQNAVPSKQKCLYSKFRQTVRRVSWQTTAPCQDLPRELSSCWASWLHLLSLKTRLVWLPCTVNMGLTSRNFPLAAWDYCSLILSSMTLITTSLSTSFRCKGRKGLLSKGC